MTIAEQIRQRLAEIAAASGPAASMLGIVASINEQEGTCVLLNDDIEIFDVRLRPVITGKESITIYPKAGAWALAVRVENENDWCLIATEEADKLRMKVGNCVFEITDGFLVQKSGDTLLDVVKLIIEACQQIMVLQGNNPNYVKLSQALAKANNLLK